MNLINHIDPLIKNIQYYVNLLDGHKNGSLIQSNLHGHLDSVKRLRVLINNILSSSQITSDDINILNKQILNKQLEIVDILIIQYNNEIEKEIKQLELKTQCKIYVFSENMKENIKNLKTKLNQKFDLLAAN